MGRHSFLIQGKQYENNHEHKLDVIKRCSVVIYQRLHHYYDTYGIQRYLTNFEIVF